VDAEHELTILLVEDSPDDAFFFQRALKKTGLKAALHVAEHGQEATDYLTNQGRFSDPARYARPDVVFIDLKTPGLNGFELLEWMRAQFAETPFRAVFLTSSDEPRDHQRALDLGVDGYFLKPISPEQLRAVVTGSCAGHLPLPS
jgi:two-component system response regulator